MPTQLTEGYEHQDIPYGTPMVISTNGDGTMSMNQSQISPGNPDAANWLGSIRKEMRQEFVRRMVSDRIKNGGFEGFPSGKQYQLDWCKIVEAFILGTAVAITANWLLVKLNIRK